MRRAWPLLSSRFASSSSCAANAAAMAAPLLPIRLLFFVRGGRCSSSCCPPSIPPLLFSSSLRSGAVPRRGSRSGWRSPPLRSRGGRGLELHRQRALHWSSSPTHVNSEQRRNHAGARDHTINPIVTLGVLSGWTNLKMLASVHRHHIVEQGQGENKGDSPSGENTN
ncbi:uncharacterized protein LOC119278845 [Triticum dicoccoides]|uniref:uncharacterized protein LOC119278845 n=1 Tax=Triticum dicoccoides TaxID=85692 RepID=UPI00189016FA|nr:uncharacterized protein LOC119278845 [Triticum dicoccoides]